MFDIKNIYEPDTLTDAIKLYGINPHLRIIAGGTDVLIKIRHGEVKDAELLSIGKIKELKEIKSDSSGTISIGALVTFSDIIRSELISSNIPILREAAVSMGGPQIRNIATIGGNISNGAVSADSAPALFALDARLKLVSINGIRVIPIRDFYAGPGFVKLNPGEILTEILITKENYIGFKGRYIKFSNRKAMDIAMLSVAVLFSISNRKFSDMRIALGVAGPTPLRCIDAENFARGKEISENVIKEISELTLKTARARDSWRGSKMYREHLIKVLSERAVKELLENEGADYAKN